MRVLRPLRDVRPSGDVRQLELEDLVGGLEEIVVGDVDEEE